MTTETRKRITATPLYPGSFMPEDGRPVVIADGSPETALAALRGDASWFCIEVRTFEEKRWTDGEGGEMWKLTDASTSKYRIYIGEEFTAEQIDAWPDAETYRILVSNMRGNQWPTVVRTRRGNFQPVEPGDVVLSPAEVSA